METITYRLFGLIPLWTVTRKITEDKELVEKVGNWVLAALKQVYNR